MKTAHTRARSLGAPTEDPLTPRATTTAPALLSDRLAALERALTTGTSPGHRKDRDRR